MRRKFLTMICVVGLSASLLCWVVSYWRIQWISPGRTLRVQVSQGAVSWERSINVLGVISKFYVSDDSPPLRCFGYAGLHTRWGMRYFAKGFVPTGAPKRHGSIPSLFIQYISIPLYIPVLLFGSVLIYAWYIPFRRRRRRLKLGLCLVCGYDLRASAGRCPECGRKTGSTSQTA